MTPVEFTTAFRAVYDRASARYAHGGASAANLLNEADIDFLASQGITAQHVFDYVEDLANYGAPDFATAHAIELVRRDYFLNTQNGCPSTVVLDPASLPAKTATLLGMTWLPRLIPKARAKLRGELPASMMFCCGGDREFFKKHAITAAEFLSIVGTHETDDSAVATEILRRSGKTSHMSFPIELRRYLLTAITASLLIGGTGGFALFAATALTSGTSSLVLVLYAIVVLPLAGFGLFFVPRWYHRAGHIVSSTTPIAAIATFTLETDSDSTSLTAAVSVPHSPTKLRKQIALLSPKWDRRALLGSSRSVQLFIDPSSSRLVAISTDNGMLWCMPIGQVIPLTSYRP